MAVMSHLVGRMVARDVDLGYVREALPAVHAEGGGVTVHRAANLRRHAEITRMALDTAHRLE